MQFHSKWTQQLPHTLAPLFWQSSHDCLNESKNIRPWQRGQVSVDISILHPV